jgi:hypothetical protein
LYTAVFNFSLPEYKRIMPLKIFFFVLLWLKLFHHAVQAQKPGYLSDSLYLGYLNTLRSGVLLVRLSDRAGIREKLVQYDERERLAQFDRRLNAEFKSIFDAFARNYTFGRVYFFLKSETHLLREGKFKEIIFYNVKGEKVAFETINTKNFIIGEFGNMNRTSRGPLIKTSGTDDYSSSKGSISAFYMMDANFETIPRSYYLYSRVILRTKSRVIHQLNKRLERNLRML